MGAPRVAVVCMPERGHVQRILPAVSGLAARGCRVDVLVDRRFREPVERAGGRFVDLFAGCPLESADVRSVPVPCRYVSFAGVHGEAVTRRIAALDPALLVYDTFAVVAPLAARRLGIPHVNVCAGHASVPERAVAALREDPRVAIAPECHAAVRRLREELGMPEAHPFSYVDALSPWLNLYCEPPPFLGDDDRRVLEPVAFFGALAPDERGAAPGAPVFGPRAGARRVYVSFGTVIWRYFAPAARAALAVVADTAAGLDLDVVIGLGGHAEAGPLARELARRNVRAVPYVDQWRALAEADVFVTHHGLNSTHESVFQRVPMLSYPFFGDQPALARRCQELGLALPLADAPQAPLAQGALRRALERLADERERFDDRLARARRWELDTIARRGEVLDAILALA